MESTVAPLPSEGAAVAVFATARHLAKRIYRMLRFGQDYIDIGEHAYERRFQLRRLASLTEAARSLGFHPRRADGNELRCKFQVRSV